MPSLFASMRGLEAIATDEISGMVEIAMSKVSLTEAVPSLAVTLTDTLPVAVGVPEKVRVLAAKVSQAGSAPPSPCVAV